MANDNLNGRRAAAPGSVPQQSSAQGARFRNAQPQARPQGTAASAHAAQARPVGPSAARGTANPQNAAAARPTAAGNHAAPVRGAGNAATVSRTAVPAQPTARPTQQHVSQRLAHPQQQQGARNVSQQRARGASMGGIVRPGVGSTSRSGASASSRASRPTRAQGTASHRGARPVASAHSARRNRPQQPKRRSLVPVVLAAVLLLAVVCVGAFVVVPAVNGFLNPTSTVEAGKTVRVTIPEGASGDTIAAELSKKHVIEDPKDYYAAVKSLGADTALKPGEYEFTTLMDAKEVVQQLMQGPNASGTTLTIPEGYTVDQVASLVESSLGISASDFKAQAKASNYASDYSFLSGAYNDSLEGYLYPKKYTFTSDSLSADTVIRKMLDQFQAETKGTKLSGGANGLSSQQIVSLASLIERETAVDDERPTVASVIYNRLNKDMFLQIDAAIVYARGGGSSAVTYSDLEIDSPYNVYKNKGLTPGPICSPSISSIKAALSPASTDYLYYVASSAGDGTHKFTSSYEEFEKLAKEYTESVS